MRSKNEKPAVPDTNTKAVRRKKVSAIKMHPPFALRQNFDKINPGADFYGNSHIYG